MFQPGDVPLAEMIDGALHASRERFIRETATVSEFIDPADIDPEVLAELARGKARVFLREWFGGGIQLEPLPDGGLMAHWNENAAALLRHTGTFGSGGRI